MATDRTHTRRGVRAALLLVALAAVVVGAPPPAAAHPAATDVRTWSLVAQSDGVKLGLVTMSPAPDGMHVSSTSRTVSYTALRGITAGDLNAAPGGEWRFEVPRDAGTLVCEGFVGNGRGKGTFDVVPSAAFQHELARRGIRDATSDEMMELIVDDFKTSTLDAIAAGGFTDISPAGLVTIGEHGVTTDYLAGFKNVALRPKTLAGLALLHDHGVNAAYAQALAATGYRPLSVDDLATARDHGVGAKLLGALTEAHFRPLSGAELATLSDHGTSPDLVRGLAASPYRDASAAEIARLADHGVTGDYITGLTRIGYHPAVADVARLHDYGVTVSFIQRLHDHGFGSMSVDDVIKLSTHGI
ncbi:MAG: hypothetical protein JOZ86_05835 [Candidatus Eremiobacteraeota bacterium]|nr:hypothetical protein [Candidatus Eremiobacteraeota bacterium]